MSDQDPAQPLEPSTPVEPPGAAPGPVADPRDTELAELRAYAAQARETFERLKPHEEYIRRIVEDDETREFTKTAWESYDDQKARRKAATEPKLDPAAQALVDAFYEKVKPELEYVGKLRERETPEYQAQEAAKRASDEFARTNIEYAQRLMAEHGLSQEDILEVGAYAQALHERSKAAGAPRFVGLEEAWRKMTSRSAAPARAAAPSTPRSLRASAATPGIPGGSTAAVDRAKISKPGGLTAYMVEKLAKQRKGA